MTSRKIQQKHYFFQFVTLCPLLKHFLTYFLSSFDHITASSPGPRRGAGHGTGAALSTDLEEEETGQEEAEQNKIKSGVKSWR